MIIYDIVKLLILSLLENNNIEENFQYDFSTTFALIADSYMVIEKTDSGGYFSGAKKDIYLPYECIVRVDFITDITHTYYKFSGKHNLKEIK